MTIQEIRAAQVALSAKRQERSHENLSGLQMKLFQQFSEFELRKMSLGKWKEPLVLREIVKPKKTIIAIPKVDKDLPKVPDPEPIVVKGSIKKAKKKPYKKPTLKKEDDET